jgi:hypothetical protein
VPAVADCALQEIDDKSAHPPPINAVGHRGWRGQWGRRTDRFGRENATIDSRERNTLGRGLITLEQQVRIR